MNPSDHPADLLLQWRKREKLSFARAGLRLGVTGPTVQDWERRRKRPRDGSRDVIQEVVGIDRNLWRTPEERATIERLIGPTSEAPAKRGRRPATQRTTVAERASRAATG